MTRLRALVRLEKDTVLALQQALEEAKQSWGASESEANTALATCHSHEVPPAEAHPLQCHYTPRTP